MLAIHFMFSDIIFCDFVFQKLQMLEVKSVGSQFGGKLIVSDDELEREVNWNPSRIPFHPNPFIQEF